MDMNDKPIISYFKIIGLHGYKDVVIDFNAPVRVVIAENGAGKTTILSAMYFFLTCKFNKLKSIDFEEIICAFNGSDHKVTLRKQDLSEISLPNLELFHEIVEYADADESDVIAYVTSEFDPKMQSSFKNSHIAASVYYNSPWEWETIHEIFSEMRDHYEAAADAVVHQVAKQVKAEIGDTEILYLPTYRRIEKLFSEENEKRKKRRNYSPYRQRLNQSLSVSSEVNYGLADVEERLAALTEDIQRKTNIGYRQISASIIDDLLAGKNQSSKFDLSELPELETLKLFFSRIGGTKERGESNLNRIQEIYDLQDQKYEEENRTLIYFLSKLSQVVDQTKQLESMIEQFVSKANTYLGNTSDVKSFNYDPERMKVSVINKWTSEEIKLNDLSSGEKQIVSLLSYLFLYSAEKIILLDEPELSLSIDWQQKILVDMVDASSCKQLLAITHSPFIFDNELDEYGSSLKITRKEKAAN